MHRPIPLRRQRTAPGPNPQRGIALIEALISILIFSFGILGLIGLEAQAINFSVNAEDRNRASMFANEIASYMWENATVSVPASQLTTWQQNILASNNPQGGLNAGTVSVTPTAGSTYSADIVITWQQVSDNVVSGHPTTTPVTQTLTTRVIIAPIP